MIEAPRYTINRRLVLLRHTQTFLDWLKGVDSDPTLTLDVLNEDSEAFLIPGDTVIRSEADALGWVEAHWSVLFDHMLNEWITDEETWPKKRSLKMFRQWFTIEHHSMVWDLDKTEIQVEDWSDDSKSEDDDDDTDVVVH
jgi:hypothetical protein